MKDLYIQCDNSNSNNNNNNIIVIICTVEDDLSGYTSKLHVVHTQVEVLWRLRQKLIVMTSLSVHMMTSQVLVCLVFLILGKYNPEGV